MTRKSHSRPRLRPGAERLEGRRLLSFADGNGAIVTSLVASTGPSGSRLTVGFDGPLESAGAQDVANYRVNALIAGVSPEIVTTNGPNDPVVAASYGSTTDQVTLSLAGPLRAGATYRVWINGTPGSGLLDADGVGFDGDDDDTPYGDFFGLVSEGSNLTFNDSQGDRAAIRLEGPGTLSLWRGLDGDAEVLDILGSAPGQTALTGSVRPARGSPGLVVLPSIVGLAGVNNQLPASFVSTPPPPPPSAAPVVATPENLGFSLQIAPVAMPSVPAIQAADYVESGGKWLVFGGLTDGLHGFDDQSTDPTGTMNFPPEYQNPNIYVIDPSTGQTWTEAWASTGLPASWLPSLSAANQEFTRVGDRLYAIGGYSDDPITQQFTTYDTLSSIRIGGLIDAVMNGGSAVGLVDQVQDPRLRVTGGALNTIGGRAFLDFGQDFQGGYNGNNADFSQVYSDEIRSFRIVDRGKTLGIANYRAQRDPIAFRRRDSNLAEPTILPGGQRTITAYGGVFTSSGDGYRQPVAIGLGGIGRVDTHYEQYFSQYTSATAGLFDARTRSMDRIFFGGISLSDYDFATGTLSQDTELPFVDDVTTLVQPKDGATQEYMMPSQLPVGLGPYSTNYYGAEAAFFASPSLPSYPNGVLKLNAISSPTTLGYIYGGIVANAGDFGSSTASPTVFRVTIVPS